MSRRQAREIALQALFQMDLNHSEDMVSEEAQGISRWIQPWASARRLLTRTAAMQELWSGGQGRICLQSIS